MKIISFIALMLAGCNSVPVKPQPALVPPTTKYMLYSQQEITRLEKVKGDVLADYLNYCHHQESFLACYHRNAVAGHLQTQTSLIANLQNLHDLRTEEEKQKKGDLLPLFRFTAFTIQLVQSADKPNRLLYDSEMEKNFEAEIKQMREVEDANLLTFATKLREDNRATLNKFTSALKDGKHRSLAKTLTQRDVNLLVEANEATARLFPAAK